HRWLGGGAKNLRAAPTRPLITPPAASVRGDFRCPIFSTVAAHAAAASAPFTTNGRRRTSCGRRAHGNDVASERRISPALWCPTESRPSSFTPIGRPPICDWQGQETKLRRLSHP